MKGDDTMKLSVKELQMLDLLLKKTANVLNNKPSNTQELKFNLIISYNSSFWSGDFIILNKSFIEEKFIDYDNWIEVNTTASSSLIKLIPDFSFSRYSYIEEDSLHLLLESLIHCVKKADLTTLNFMTLLYNPINLETGFKLPFINLDSNQEYEVVSIKVTKE